MFYKKLLYRLEREFMGFLVALLGFVRILSEFLKPSFDIETATITVLVIAVSFTWFFIMDHVQREYEKRERIFKKFFGIICEDSMDREEFKKHTIMLIIYTIAVTLAFILLR